MDVTGQIIGPQLATCRAYAEYASSLLQVHQHANAPRTAGAMTHGRRTLPVQPERVGYGLLLKEHVPKLL